MIPQAGPDGWVYFGQGTATNSGVVGEDSAKFGWLKRFPQFHDIPARDVVLTGENYETRERGKGRLFTGAFLPYGTPSQRGQVIPGRVPATGAIMRVPRNGGKPQLVAWGGEAGLGPAINDKPLPEFLIKTQVRVGLGAMPSFHRRQINEDELDDLIRYLKALRGNRT